MTVKDTSIAAFLNKATQSKLNTREAAVYDTLLRGGPATRLQLARYIKVGVNGVCAPVKRLLDAGIIEEHERVLQPETGIHVWNLRIKETPSAEAQHSA